jgi:hypothetical protein
MPRERLDAPVTKMAHTTGVRTGCAGFVGGWAASSARPCTMVVGATHTHTHTHGTTPVWRRLLLSSTSRQVVRGASFSRDGSDSCVGLGGWHVRLVGRRPEGVLDVLDHEYDDIWKLPVARVVIDGTQ